MRLCKDCRYVVGPASGGDEDDWTCSHPSSLFKRRSAVTGEMRSDQLKCYLVRSVGDCGREGKFWEAKDSGSVGFV